MKIGRPEPVCDPFQHEWEEVYYGYSCQKCGQFVAFGCEPWAPDEEDEGHFEIEEAHD